MSDTLLIVDDEQPARERMQRLIAGLEAAPAKVLTAANGEEALRICQAQAVSIVLLDIRMPGMDGLEAARHIASMEEPPAVIFCTAYEEHAVEAFNVQAVGYLLKPVRKEALEQALAGATRTNKAQLAALSSGEENRRTHISARTRRGIELVPVEEVRFLHADQKYVTVKHADGELLIDETLRELEEEFEDVFVRVHRNCLIASRHVEGLEKDDAGHYRVKLRGVEEQPDVSRRHVARVRKFVRSL